MRLLERLCDDYITADEYQGTAAVRELTEKLSKCEKNIIEKIGRNVYLKIESDISRSEEAGERYGFAIGVNMLSTYAPSCKTTNYKQNGGYGI